jgi:hypothetical protein
MKGIKNIKKGANKVLTPGTMPGEAELSAWVSFLPRVE